VYLGVNNFKLFFLLEISLNNAWVLRLLVINFVLDLASLTIPSIHYIFPYVFEDKINAMNCVAIVSDMKLYIHVKSIQHFCTLLDYQ
jgi:hypothetical protein